LSSIAFRARHIHFEKVAMQSVPHIWPGTLSKNPVKAKLKTGEFLHFSEDLTLTEGEITTD